jgi:hypothetical protein
MLERDNANGIAAKKHTNWSPLLRLLRFIAALIGGRPFNFIILPFLIVGLDIH